MRTDTIFYQLFQTFPSLLFELIGQSPTEAQGYQFSSQEIKELAFRFDGVFLPTTDSFEQTIYFIEVQFPAKSEFYWRLRKLLLSKLIDLYNKHNRNLKMQPSDRKL